jgi:hypothetical protein
MQVALFLRDGARPRSHEGQAVEGPPPGWAAGVSSLPVRLG